MIQKYHLEWKLTTICNYNCFYCKLKKANIELDEIVLKEFMNSLDKNIELFCFGGEPFLHPKIKFIINHLNKIKQPFVIQSNGSIQSLDMILKNKLNNFNLQISVHPNEVTINNVLKSLKKITSISKKLNINLRRVDVMYEGKKSIIYYKKIKEIFPTLNLYLLPIAGFILNDKESDISCEYLKEYNNIRYKYKNIQFEMDFIEKYNKYRSEVWQNQCEGKLTTINRECPYNYNLYDSDLQLYNCCHTKRNDNGICKNERCFWM